MGAPSSSRNVLNGTTRQFFSCKVTLTGSITLHSLTLHVVPICKLPSNFREHYFRSHSYLLQLPVFSDAVAALVRISAHNLLDQKCESLFWSQSFTLHCTLMLKADDKHCDLLLKFLQHCFHQ